MTWNQTGTAGEHTSRGSRRADPAYDKWRALGLVQCATWQMPGPGCTLAECPEVGKVIPQALDDHHPFPAYRSEDPLALMSRLKNQGFVVTSRDHRVKKLLQIYWEIVEKTKAERQRGLTRFFRDAALEDNGDLKEEMILVCNALRNDLMHANE